MSADEVANLKRVLYALIAWMAGSANSPISVGEARELLRMLDEEGKP